MSTHTGNGFTDLGKAEKVNDVTADGPRTWLVTRADNEAPFVVDTTIRAVWFSPPVDVPWTDIPGARVNEEPDRTTRVSGIVTVVAAFEEELDDEQGCLHLAQVRAATPTDAAQVLLGEPHHARRAQLTKRVHALLAWGDPTTVADAQRPPSAPVAVHTLPPVPLGPDPEVVVLNRLHLDRAKGLVWTTTTVPEGQVGNLGRTEAISHPLTPAREQLVADLCAEYGVLCAWCTDDGYESRAAWMLSLKGWTPTALATDAGALSMHTAGDAQAFLARPFTWWTARGWGAHRPDHDVVPACDAARLAEAGVTCAQAAQLHAQGFDTVDEMLTARRRLPNIGKRFVLRAAAGQYGVVTDDPDLAQKFLNVIPSAWDHAEFTAGDVTCVHVDVQRDWQVWSDGVFTRGVWLSPSQPALPAVAADVVEVVMAASDPSVIPPALRRSFFTANIHERRVIEQVGSYSPDPADVSEVALIGHTVIMPDRTAVFWRVVTADGGRIGSGATQQVTSIYLYSDTARTEYQRQCANRRLGGTDSGK